MHRFRHRLKSHVRFVTNNPEAEIYSLVYRSVDIRAHTIQNISGNIRINTAKWSAYLHYTIIMIRLDFWNIIGEDIYRSNFERIAGNGTSGKRCKKIRFVNVKVKYTSPFAGGEHCIYAKTCSINVAKSIVTRGFAVIILHFNHANTHLMRA